MAMNSLLTAARPGMGAKVRINRSPGTTDGRKALENLLGNSASFDDGYRMNILRKKRFEIALTNEQRIEEVRHLGRRDQSSRNVLIVEDVFSKFLIILGSSAGRAGDRPVKADSKPRLMPSSEDTKRAAADVATRLKKRVVSDKISSSSGSLSVISGSGKDEIHVRPLPSLGVVAVAGDVTIGELESLGLGRVVPSASLHFDVPEIETDQPNHHQSWHLGWINGLGGGSRIGKAALPVSIGIADSGISPEAVRSEFRGRSVKFASFRGWGAGVADINGPYQDRREDAHGTKMACLAAGSIRGICRDADLVVASCFDDAGGDAMAIVTALDWLLEELRNRDGIKILNLSFNSRDQYGNDARSEIFRTPINDALNANVFVVGSIGNTGEGNPGSPGDYREVIGVGACDKRGKLYKKCSHGYVESVGGGTSHYKPDFVAPGVQVLSINATGKVKMVTGTSASAAVASGITAEILRTNSPKTANLADAFKAIQDCGSPMQIGRKTHRGDCHIIPKQP